MKPTAERRPSPAPESVSSPAARDLTELQRGILLTVLYSDMFDYPLTADELERYLLAPYPGAKEYEEELAPLFDRHLVRTGELISLIGRDDIVEVRRRRQETRDERWQAAQRYARWLRYVPFLRMVAVCGSQAAGNPRPDADIDFFLVTEPGRLWTVQVCSMVQRRVASLLSVRVCPNYFLTLDSLEVQPRDLYHAREVAQTMPLWGGATHLLFLQANDWIGEFLPNLAHADDRRSHLREMTRPRLVRGWEWLMGGGLGSLLERTIHWSLLSYYPLRLAYLGWKREQFRSAYRRDRQVVMRGGYGPIVEKAFRERVAMHLGEAIADEEMLRLFPPSEAEGEPDDLYARLFSARYGRGDDDTDAATAAAASDEGKRR